MDKIAARRLALVGHYNQYPELPASCVIRESTHSRMDPGRPPETKVKSLIGDTGAAPTGKLSTKMEERAVSRVHHLACFKQEEK